MLSRRERETLGDEFVRLAFQITGIAGDYAAAYASKDRTAVQALLLQAVLALHKALLPLAGAAPLKPLEDILALVEAALHKRRDQLTALPEDAPDNRLPVRQDCPRRGMMKVLAAATFSHFAPKTKQLGLPKRKIAAEIGQAMGRGGFYVPSSRGQMRPPSGATIEDELKRIVGSDPNPKRRNVPEYLKEMFAATCARLETDAGEHDAPEHFRMKLRDLENECRRTVAPLPIQ